MMEECREIRPRLVAEDVMSLWPIWNEDDLLPQMAELQDRLIDLNEQAQTIQALADKDKRDLTEDEETEIDRISAEFEHTEAEIKRRNRITAQTLRLTQSMGRQTTPEGPDVEDEPQPQPRAQGQQQPRRQNRGIEPMFTDKGKWGWRNMGEFSRAVAVASKRGGSVDPRLDFRNAPTTYGQEGVGGDGGYAVPPDFRTAIVQTIMGEASLLGRTDQQISTSNVLTLPVDETSAWQTTGGILASWESEGGLKDQSKPSLNTLSLRLNKLTVMVPVTDELLEDASSMSTYIGRKAPEKIDFKINLALIQGSGVGQPRGILNSPCLVTVSKENGQLADTIQAENIMNMYSRMWGPSRSNAIWLVNQDIEPQLFQMTVGVNNWPIYLPPNGLAGAPFATLLGRPVIPTQACETLGDKGDIIFADMSQFLTATKGGGLRQDVSIHLWFDYDVTAFRFVLRIGGQAWWSAAVSPRDGNNTLSPFVTLAERA